MYKTLSILVLVLIGLSIACGGTSQTTNYYVDSDAGMKAEEAVRKSASGTLISGDLLNDVSLQTGDLEAGVYTISFNAFGTDQSIIPIRTEAYIQFSIDGQTTTRRISVGNGVSISGPAENVVVKIKDTTDRTDLSKCGIQYQVSMQVARGSRASVQQPATLQPEPYKLGNPYNLTSLTGKGIPVPLDAGIVSVYITTVGNEDNGGIPPGAALVQFNVGGTAAGKYDPNRTDGWVPLPPGTTTVNLLNLTSMSPFDIEFTVTFGVDG